MNVFCGIGRLTKDPDIRQAGETQVARYTLAVDRQKKGEADFIPCVAFGKAAEFAEKYLSKGMKVGVTGRIQTGSYTNKDGQKVYTTDVIVGSHTFCEKKGEAAAPSAPDGVDDFMNVPTDIDDEMPFGN